MNNWNRNTSIRERIEKNVGKTPDAIAFYFVEPDLPVPKTVTFQELHEKAEAIAGYLQSKLKFGETVLLVYAPGIDFISAMLGCFYAGIIAVPTYPPTNIKLIEIAKKIIKDCSPSLILSTTNIVKKVSKLKVLNTIEKFLPLKIVFPAWSAHHEFNFANLDWIGTDNLPHVQYRPIQIQEEHVAYLQYTSGTTGSPKGVMISHNNLIANIKIIHDAFAADEKSLGVSWLPPYHDMGLIGHIISPIIIGAHSILMSPISFLKNPFFWLETINRYKAAISGGPNFAYEYCVKKITKEQKTKLDLSCWDVAYCGAEVISKSTLDNFYQAFKSCGFKKKAFATCYGLAEATLCVSVAKKQKGYKSILVAGEKLKKHRIEMVDNQEMNASYLVSSGIPKQKIVIVNPDTRQLSDPNDVGEIWVTGSSVTLGYWKNPTLTKDIFQAHLINDEKTAYMRTGDLGFMYEQELYVTGRIKDVIIIRGKNYYPQDIENSVVESHPALRRGCCAAFSVLKENIEQVAILCEVEKLSNYNDIIHAITKSIARDYQLAIATIVLIRTKTLPKTTSGKIQRSLAREQLLSNKLSSLFVWTANQTCVSKAVTSKKSKGYNFEIIRDWLVNTIANRLNISPESINIDSSFSEFGIDSVAVVELSTQFEEEFHITLDINYFWDFSTINQLSNFLAETQIVPAKEKINQVEILGEKGIFHKGGKTGVLIIHGLTGTPGEVSRLAYHLSKENFTIALPQLAGHCSTFDALKKTNSDDWYASILKAFNLLQQHCTKIFVVGLSAGSLLGLKLAAEKKMALVGAILLSPILFFDGWNVSRLQKILLPLIMYTPLANLFTIEEKWPYGVKDKNVRSKIEAIVKKQGDQTSESVGNMKIPGVFFKELKTIFKNTKKILPEVQNPVLIIHSLEDQLASIKNIAFITSRIGSRQINLRYLDDCYHIITIDRKNEEVTQHILSFLRSFQGM